jgi:type IV pilus assembly protein PilW
MTAPRPRRARGFTLVELMVALTVSVLTVAAAMTLLIQQQRAYVATSGDRAQQEAGRLALQDLLQRLKHAGYGVDPNLTLDFGENTGDPDGAPRTNLRPPATFVKVSSFKCDAPVRCRDRTDGSDELVFYARDPWFQRVATKVDKDRLTLLGELKVPLYRGQILQVSCMGGSRTRAYVTVRDLVKAADAPDATKEVQVDLEGGQQDAGREVFPFENAQLEDGCFSLAGAGTQPVVTAVERNRYYVGWYLPDGGVVAPQTPLSRPYLMLDQGLFDEQGQEILVPVANDVEDVQFSFYYPPAAAGGEPRLVGATPGTNAADEAFKLQADVVPPAMDDLADDPARTTGHPANIQAVRVSVVVRQPEPDIGLLDPEGSTVPAAGNRPALQGERFRRRSLFETTVVLRNQQSTFFVYPVRPE